MIRTTVGRRAPRRLLQDVITPATAVRSIPTDAVVASSSTPTASPLSPVYVELTAPFAPKETDPAPKETLVALDPTVFNEPLRRDILHLCVIQFRDSLRQGTASTKTRGEVAGSGRKIRPQKGTGRARLGDAQSPMLRGGGIAFGPKPRDFSTKLPRKVIDMGMRVALSQKLRENSFGVMNHMDWSIPKTKTLVQRLKEMEISNTLFVTGNEQVPSALDRAIRNIPLVDVITTSQLRIWDVLKWRRVVLDSKAVEYLEEKLGRKPSAAKAVAPPAVSRNARLLEASL